MHVDANIIGIIIADREGRILEANDAFLRILGYDREDLVSGRVRRTELTPPEWRDHNIRALAELDSTGAAQPFEKEYFRKDGSRVPVLVGAALFKEGGDRLAFVLDLTERKRAEDRLRRSEAWLSQAQRLSRSGNWVYSAKRSCIFIGPTRATGSGGLIRSRAFQAVTICCDASTRTIETE